MLAQLQACHFAPNRPSYTGVQQRIRPRRQQQAVSTSSRSSTTVAAAAPRRKWLHAEYVSGLGALLSSNQLPQAVALIESWLDNNQRVHGQATGQLLEALCEAGQHDTTWALLRRLTAAHGRLPLQVLHRLLKQAGQFGTVADVRAVYDHQQQLYGFASAAVQTTLIHALLKAHNKSQPGHLLAYEAWTRLRGSRMNLDAQALLAGIHACACVGQFRQAEALLEPLKAAAGAASQPITSAYNIMMKGHVAADNLEAARKVFASMTSRGITPDRVTYNTLLMSFVRSGDLARARALLKKMRVDGVAPDIWSYTQLVLGFGQQGQLSEMHEILEEMQQVGLAPNSATLAAMIDAHASAGDLQEAQQLLQELETNIQAGNVLANSTTTSSSSSSSSSSPTSKGTAQAVPAAAVAAGAAPNSRSTDAGSVGGGIAAESSGSAASALVEAVAVRDREEYLHSFKNQKQTSTAGVNWGPEQGAAATAAAAAAIAAARQSSITFQQLQQQQQPPQVRRRGQGPVGGSRNSMHVLRHQYNTLIKGWLLKAAAAAAVLQQADDEQWLTGSRGFSSSSSSSASSSLDVDTAAVWPVSGAASGRRAVSDSMVQQQQQVSRGVPGSYTVADAAIRSANGTTAVADAPVVTATTTTPATPAAAARPAVAGGLIRPVLPVQAPPIVQQAAAAAAEADGQAFAGHAGGSGQLLSPNAAASPISAAAAADQALAFTEALGVLQGMQTAGVAPGADTYTLFIDYCIKVGDPGQLQQMLDAASAAGVQPDQVMLTTLVKAAWRAGDHGAAVEVFNALLRITAPLSRTSSPSSSPASRSSSNAPSTAAYNTNSSSSSNSRPGGTANGAFSSANSSSSAGSSYYSNTPADAAATAAAGGSNAWTNRSSGYEQQQQQQQQQQVLLSQTLQAYARAAAAAAAAANAVAAASQSSQAMLSSSNGAEVSSSYNSSDTEEQQQPQPRPQMNSRAQLLLPLTAPQGPDAAAWNALVAALSKAGQLDEAAVALERGLQASAAAGASKLPVEGFSALIRSYKRCGMKGKAVAALRRFLSLGGRPGRVMCDDVIALCLQEDDVRTARQVVRAMELTGSLTEADSSFYDAWFGRWEAGRAGSPAWAAAGGTAGTSSAYNMQGDSAVQGGSSSSGGGAPVAVERLKWWLGLPNSYYAKEISSGQAGNGQAGRSQGSSTDSGRAGAGAGVARRTAAPNSPRQWQ